MSDRPVVRPFAAHQWRTYRELRLAALADSPDAFGSTLAREEAFPDETWTDRLAAGVASARDLPLVAEIVGRPVGLAWGRIEPAEADVAHLYQMWVAPEARRVGVGQRLLDAVIEWARGTGVRALVLGVGQGNTAAMRLYLRAGFRPEGEPEPIRPGATVHAQPMRLEFDSPAV